MATSVCDNLDLVVAFCRQNHEDCLVDEFKGEYDVELDEIEGLRIRAKKTYMRDWEAPCSVL
jgi:hypothetical protein